MNIDAMVSKFMKEDLDSAGVKSAILLCKDSDGRFLQNYYGDGHMLNGMLDQAKRDMYLRLHSRSKDKELGEK